MIKNWSFAKITDILQKKLRSAIVSQNHYLNKILDVHPLRNISPHDTLPLMHQLWLLILTWVS